MISSLLKRIVFWLLIVVIAPALRAQLGLCPSNLDFESGDFTNWLCRTGGVSLVNGVNTIAWTGSIPVTGRHTIISTANAGIDRYGLFPKLCPNGSSYSVLLGDAFGGTKAEALSYTYTIPASLSSFSILFQYAVVLQNPLHGPEEQPRFKARITDLTGNVTLTCVDFDFVSSSSLPGFYESPVDYRVLCKNWTAVSVNLSQYIGKTIKIEFVTSDCTRGDHFGYAYIDVSSACNGAISGNTICAGDSSITLTAPYGFQSYRWFADNSFSQVISTTQALSLNPIPAVGTIFPVVIDPFAGFGCPDTLYAAILPAVPKPVSNAGVDSSICKYQKIKVGGPPTAGQLYSWTPANQVDNPISSNPTVWNINNGQVQSEFIVKTTDALTGCYSTDTMVLSTIQIDTSVTMLGNYSNCASDPLPVLTAHSSASLIQWHDGSSPISGANSSILQPSQTGTYWATISKDGCKDSTSRYPIAFHPLPQAGFTPVTDTGCITNNSFLFTNLSSVSDGSSLSYLWKFSDGSRPQTMSVTRSFQSLGVHPVELVVTTGFGCKDSTTGTVQIFSQGIPDFSLDSICVGRPVIFQNLSNENGSPKVDYKWDFDNGGAGSSLKDPIPEDYTGIGKASINLTMTTVGCENDPQSITKVVTVNKSAAAIRYRDITVPAGQTWPIEVRDSIGNKYNWQPQVQLSNYNSSRTNFIATGNDVEYLVNITDDHSCVTTDTLRVLVLKKPGHYLPNAFTPNGDGLNETVIPYLVGMKSLKDFSIFDRWGNLVFHTQQENKGWDGKYKGVDQPVGVYIWILKFVNLDDKIVTEKGTITIVR